MTDYPNLLPPVLALVLLLLILSIGVCEARNCSSTAAANPGTYAGDDFFLEQRK